MPSGRFLYCAHQSGPHALPPHPPMHQHLGYVGAMRLVFRLR